MKKDLLKDLLMYDSSAEGGYISLDEYAKKMPESQKFIYYAASDSAKRAARLPQTEPVREAGFDILYMTEDVDEFVVQILGEYEGKRFCNVSSDDPGLETDSQKADAEKLGEENKELLAFVRDSLGGEVEDVRISHKLRTQPVCLGTEGDITLEVERYFNSLPMAEGKPVKARKILELNGNHPAFEALKKAYAEDKDRAAKLSKILYAQSELIAGVEIEDPTAYADLVCSLF